MKRVFFPLEGGGGEVLSPSIVFKPPPSPNKVTQTHGQNEYKNPTPPIKYNIYNLWNYFCMKYANLLLLRWSDIWRNIISIIRYEKEKKYVKLDFTVGWVSKVRLWVSLLIYLFFSFQRTLEPFSIKCIQELLFLSP